MEKTTTPWDAWANPALAREAAQLAVADLGKEETRVYTGSDFEAAHQDGPSRLPDLRELYYMLFSMKRSERKEMLDIPPGVGVEFVNH